MDALQCTITVPGATFHRLKINILWAQPLTKVLPFEFIFSCFRCFVVRLSLVLNADAVNTARRF